MSKQPVKSYTIEAHPLFSSKTKSQDNDIQIILTEPTMIVNEVSPKTNAILKRGNQSPTIPKTEEPARDNPNFTQRSFAYTNGYITRAEKKYCIIEHFLLLVFILMSFSTVQHEVPRYISSDKDRVRVVVR